MGTRSAELAVFAFDTPAQTLRGWTAGSPGAAGTPILFIHPINLQGKAWAAVASAFRDERFCLMPDLRGHGGSTAHRPFSVDAWVEDLLAVLDHFAVRRCHLVGGSLGGALAVAIAERVPERVVSLTGFGSTLAVGGADAESVVQILAEKGVRGMFAETIPEISVAPGTPRAVIDEILAITNPNDVATVTEIWRSTLETDVRGAADRVRAPALVVSGELDRTCPPDQGRAMAEALHAPFVLMPGVGHLPMYEAPEETAALLRGHLEKAELP
ncbi:alpha/beta fold hydrolase [Amycolatopsis jejuensis]|uniref:alpha/beta fold hydrolase n=1 Tax=Amycolatopsis jejuensis TaxID=330084 RepID=UPI0005246ABF|nr:alpha/beta hydrolase [Amycolatopsis jejuensis]